MIIENLSTLARPYANAVFEYAMATNAIPSWGRFLQNAALVTQQKEMVDFLSSPKVTKDQLFRLYEEILQPLLDAPEKINFLHILAENKRIPLLPAIFELFSKARAEYEEVINVQLISAVSLDQKYQQKVRKTLVKRLKKQVLLKNDLDPSIIGGAIIRAGDMVIDGSIRGKLNRLLETL